MSLHDILARIRARGPSSPTPPEAGTFGFYHPELDTIGQRYAVWRLPNERNRELAHRIGIEITTRQNDLEADLQAVLNYDR